MAHNRRVYGQWQNNLPSRFINELPPANIEICNKCTNFYSGDYGSSAYNKNTYSNSYNNRKFGSWNNHSKSEVTYDDDTRYSYVRSNDSYRSVHAGVIGTKVHHDTFGYGKVVAAEGNKLEVYFDDYGRKKLMASYVTKID